MTSQSPGDMLRTVAQKATSRTRWALVLVLVIALVFSGFKIYQALELAGSGKFDTYVSDEVWYVTSARTIAYEVLGITPKYHVNGTLGYTVFAATDQVLEKVRQTTFSLGGIVVKDDYKEVKAIAVGLPENVSPDVLKEIDGVEKVIPGYPYADKKNIHNYYNLEHPPLGKYIIALAMAFAEDRPINWRIPGIIEAGLLVILAALAGYRLMGLIGGVLAGAAASLDPLTTHLASVAMLDIHLAFFTTLAAFAVVYRRWTLAILLAALSGMVKYSGFFILPGLYVILRLWGWRPRRAFVRIIILSIITALVIYAPFLTAFGPVRVINEFINALKWHTTSRPQGPATSTPLDWVLGWNPFYLHLDPDVPARGSPVIYVPVFVVLILMLPGLFVNRIRRALGYGAADLLILIGSFMLGFVLVYIMGNRTLYSFYMTQAAPLFYMVLPAAAAVLVSKGSLIGASLDSAKDVLQDWLSGTIGGRRPPLELQFFWKLMFWDPMRQRALFWLIVTVSVFSLFAHWDVGQDVKLFSDAQWMVWEEGASSVEPGRLLGLQGLLALIFSRIGVHGNLLLLIDFASLLLFANEARILLNNLEKRGAKPRIYFYPMLLTLAVYGVYDGSAISLFLFMFGVNLWLEKKTLAAGLTLGLAIGNPMLLIVLPIFFALKDRSILGSMALALLLVNGALAISVGANDWLVSLASYLDSAKTAGLGLALPYPTVYIPVLVVVAVIGSIYVASRVRCKLTSLAAALLVFAALFPNPLPQWLLILAPLTILAGKRVLLPVLASDALNSLIIFLWFSTTALMKEFFKLETQGALDPLSAPALAAYLRSILLLLWAYRLSFTRGGAVERCEPTT